MEATLNGLVVKHVQVHMLEDDCPVGVVGGAPMDDAKVGPLAVQQQGVPVTPQARQTQQNFTTCRRLVRVDVSGIVLGLEHGLFIA